MCSYPCIVSFESDAVIRFWDLDLILRELKWDRRKHFAFVVHSYATEGLILSSMSSDHNYDDFLAGQVIDEYDFDDDEDDKGDEGDRFCAWKPLTRSLSTPLSAAPSRVNSFTGKASVLSLLHPTDDALLPTPLPPQPQRVMAEVGSGNSAMKVLLNDEIRRNIASYI